MAKNGGKTEKIDGINGITDGINGITPAQKVI